MLITTHTILFSQLAASAGERLESAGHRKEEGEDEEIELEEEAVDLYKWSQELSFDDLSWSVYVYTHTLHNISSHDQLYKLFGLPHSLLLQFFFIYLILQE